LQPHAKKREALAAQLRAAAGPVALAKDTSNLFRDRVAGERRRLDVRAFKDVIGFGENWVDAEGMIPYEDLTAACLARGVMPTVVPQLKTITLGGAVAGVGIESSSHRHGLVHDGMLELDVLLGDGRVVSCTPTNEHRDLFFGFPNSYGTLGYALRVRAKTIPVRPFVHLRHLPMRSFSELAKVLEANSEDFVDGTVFGPGKMFVTLGRFVDSAPYVSDYKFEKIYYRSIAERDEDYLTVADYIWRWDTDWFWCSKNVMAQNAFFRKYVFGKERLGSRTYTKIMRWNSRVGVTRKLERVLGLHSESIIQDVDIPLRNAQAFLDFYLDTVNLLPVWICPIGPQKEKFSLYPVGDEWYVNFGFWDVKRTRERHDPGHFNRLIERKVAGLGGIKSLYSDSFFARDEFAARYGGEAYARLKAKYDPTGAFPQLYDKCVLRG
jgi:FAD/FMN-containing dehydrogenase